MGWRGLLIACIAFSSSGCGVLYHVVAGWNDVTVTQVDRSHEVIVESSPRGARVERINAAGTATIAGVTPFVDVLPVKLERTTHDPISWIMLTAGGVEIGVATALYIAASLVSERSNLGTAMLTATASVLALAAPLDLVWGLIQVFRKPVVEDEWSSERTFVYRAGDATQKVELPDAKKVHLEAGAAAVIVERSGPWVVAVLEVRDANAGSEDAIGESVVRNLSDQLRVFVAARGVKTVNRSEQAKIRQLKLESYDDCYDTECQIEIGRALAASHLIRANITRFGDQCVLNGELIDLRSEITVRASTTRGGCEAEGFLAMSEALAKALTDESK